MTEDSSEMKSPPPSEDFKAASGKRLSKAEYAKAKAMWVSGRHTLNEISEVSGVSTTALWRRFNRDKVKKGEAADKMEEALNKEIAKIVTQSDFFKEYAEEALKIKAANLRALKVIDNRTFYEIGKATREEKSLALIEGELKTLDTASKIISRNYATLHKLMNFDDLNSADGDQLPEFIIRTMNDDDVAEVRKQQQAEEDLLLGGDFDSLMEENIEIDDTEEGN